MINLILEKLSLYFKGFAELLYWRIKFNSEKVFTNEHYKQFYTEHFNLDESYFNDKTILDIGCGPRGSLEWANMASCRIGLDPLASKYRSFGTDEHQMKYITSFSENIPVKNNACDVVCSFNSLDHVQNVKQTINEIKRVVSKGGLFLLIVEVNHNSRICEPHSISPNEIITLLEPEFNCERINVYKKYSERIYQSILEGEKYSNPESVNENGYLTALFRKKL